MDVTYLLQFKVISQPFDGWSAIHDPINLLFLCLIKAIQNILFKVSMMSKYIDGDKRVVDVLSLYNDRIIIHGKRRYL